MGGGGGGLVGRLDMLTGVIQFPNGTLSNPTSPLSPSKKKNNDLERPYVLRQTKSVYFHFY